MSAESFACLPASEIADRCRKAYFYVARRSAQHLSDFLENQRKYKRTGFLGLKRGELESISETHERLKNSHLSIDLGIDLHFAETYMQDERTELLHLAALAQEAAAKSCQICVTASDMANLLDIEQEMKKEVKP